MALATARARPVAFLAPTVALAATLGVARPWAAEPPASVASVDRLVVLAPDASAALAQLTLTSEGALVIYALSEDAVAGATVRFSGPERALFAAAHARRPERLALWSGSALLRYRPGPDALLVERGEDGLVTLVERAPPTGLHVEGDALGTTVHSWLLPPDLEPVAWTSGDGEGRWQRDGNLLSAERRGDAPTTLTITLRPRPLDLPAPAPCAAAADESARAADAADCVADADVDADGVPDRRDVCLPRDGDPLPASAPLEAADGLGVFGCAETEEGAPLVLADIVFPIGRSYLDLASRRALDRLAAALRHEDEGHYEIAAHTDRAGSAARNLELSTRRAEAVRHYLMLRGVGPNRLRARGYGESRPRQQGEDIAARRANRRVELRRLD